MSQDNIFREIDEDLERQRYEALWKRYGPFVIIAVLAIVLGTAAYTYSESRTERASEKVTGELASLLTQDKAADASKQIQTLRDFAATHSAAAQSALADLRAAALASKQDDKTQAIKLYDAVASNPKAPLEFKQLADLLAVQAQLDTGDTAALRKRLEPLTAPDQPWRATALEYTGYLTLKTGDAAGARRIFEGLAADPDAPKSLSQRAAEIARSLQP